MNDPRMKLTIQDMKKVVPEWEGTFETAHSSPEIGAANKGPMLKTVKKLRTGETNALDPQGRQQQDEEGKKPEG